MWVRAEPLDYVVKFDPYQGAKCVNTTRATDKTWCYEETAALLIIDVLLQNICCRVFMDHFFTTLCLLKFLAANNI